MIEIGRKVTEILDPSRALRFPRHLQLLQKTNMAVTVISCSVCASPQPVCQTASSGRLALPVTNLSDGRVLCFSSDQFLDRKTVSSLVWTTLVTARAHLQFRFVLAEQAGFGDRRGRRLDSKFK